MNLNELRTSSATLAQWASAEKAGVARSASLDHLMSIAGSTDSAVLSFPFGDSNAVVSANGTLFDLELMEKPSDKSSEQERAQYRAIVAAHKRPGWLVDPCPPLPVGAAPTNKMIGSMRIPAGVCLIVGGADVGKTPLAHALAGHGGTNYEVIRYGEPLAKYNVSEYATGALVASALLTSADIVLDSVKDVLSLAGGAAMKSGLSRAALPIFSRWSTIAATVGATIYIPVNPSSQDQEVVDLIVEAAKSNATMTVYPLGTGHWAYRSRKGEGLQRQTGDFITKFDSDGIMQISADGVGNVARTNDFAAKTLGHLSDVQFASALRRAITSTT